MAELINTADATAAASDIKSGQTAYARGQKITGTQNFYVDLNGILHCPSDWYVDGTTLVIPDSWFLKK